MRVMLRIKSSRAVHKPLIMTVENHTPYVFLVFLPESTKDIFIFLSNKIKAGIE